MSVWLDGKRFVALDHDIAEAMPAARRMGRDRRKLLMHKGVLGFPGGAEETVAAAAIMSDGFWQTLRSWIAAAVRPNATS